jgi:hypothetical protein
LQPSAEKQPTGADHPYYPKVTTGALPRSRRRMPYFIYISDANNFAEFARFIRSHHGIALDRRSYLLPWVAHLTY